MASLAAFIGGMWLIVLALAAFLSVAVVRIDDVLALHFTRVEISIVQAVISLAAVVLVILALSRMKRLYLNLKMRN